MKVDEDVWEEECNELADVRDEDENWSRKPSNTSSDDELNLEGDNENGIDSEDNLTLFNILLKNSKKYVKPTKPTGIEVDFMCTLNGKNIPLKNCLAGDNGAYVQGDQSYCSP